MSSLLLSLFILLQSSLCLNLKVGRFQANSEHETKITIDRYRDHEVWRFKNSKRKVRYSIKWIDECSYKMYDRRLLRGKEDFDSDLNIESDMKLDTIDVHISSIDNSRHQLTISQKNINYSKSMKFIRVK